MIDCMCLVVRSIIPTRNDTHSLERGSHRGIVPQHVCYVIEPNRKFVTVCRNVAWCLFLALPAVYIDCYGTTASDGISTSV